MTAFRMSSLASARRWPSALSSTRRSRPRTEGLSASVSTRWRPSESRCSYSRIVTPQPLAVDAGFGGNQPLNQLFVAHFQAEQGDAFV